MIINKDDIIIESIKKRLENPGIERLLSFWNENIVVNLSKFHYNKRVLESIDEIDKRIQKIIQIIPKKEEEEEKKKKDEKEGKRKKMIAMHNEGKMRTTYRKLIGDIVNSNFFFNTPFISEAFQKVIKDSSEDIDINNENKIDSLNNPSFIYKKEELDKNIIASSPNKEAIIKYMDIDLALQRIAMEAPIFYNEQMNNYLIEGLCLQHPNFILSEVFINKITSCFNFNYSRYLKSENETPNEEENARTDNYAFSWDNIKIRKNKKIFLGSKEEIEKMGNTIDLFQDIEKRIPYGLIYLIIIYIKTYKKFSLSNTYLSIASKIIELLKAGLDIIEIKNQFEKEMNESMAFLKEKIKSTIEVPIPNKKIPIYKIYNIKTKDKSFFDIFLFSSKDIASELTRISSFLFSKITPREFFKGLFTKKDKEKTSPNICKAVERFNTVSFWVIEEILSYDYSSDRAKVIEKFIHIANELRSLHNYNDCMSIISSLGYMIISKLNKSWKKVSSKNMTLLHKLKKVLHFQKNYKIIREEIANCKKNSKPFLPFLGYYTKSICFLEEYGPYVNKSGLINVDKIAQVELILSEFYEKNEIEYKFEIKEDIKNKLCILQCLAPKNENELEKEGNHIEPKFILCKKTKNKRITNTEKKFEENYNKNNII